MKNVAIENCSLSMTDVADTDEPLVLTRAGEPVAAVFPFSKDDLDSMVLSSNPDFLRLLEKSVKRGETEGWVPLAEVRRRLGV